MASAGLDFTNITPDNGAVRDMSQVIMGNILSPERLGDIFNIYPRVFDGDKLAIIGEFGLLGKASQGCKPTYGTDAISAAQKEWDMAEWEIAEGICYTDLEETFVKYLLRTKTAIADATDNDYIDGIVRPRLETALYKMLFRLAWFGDKSAADTSDGGVLTAGTDEDYFNLINGLWQQLFTIGTADASRVTAIAANAEATYADQKAAILTSGVASGILNNMIMSAPAKLRAASGQVIYVSLALKDALDFDLQQNNKGSELQWKSLFAGVQESTYQGIRIVALPGWDEIIQAYEDSGTAYNLPYRAVYTTKDNLLLGLGGNNDIADIRIWFDQTDQMNYILAKDKIGALVAQDDLLQLAY